MLRQIVSSFDGIPRYRFAQMALHASTWWQARKVNNSSDSKRHSAAGTTALKMPLSSPCFFLPLLFSVEHTHTRTHAATRPRPSGNGTVPGAQGCTTLGTGSFRGSTAGNLFPRCWGHIHATKGIGDRCRFEITACDDISEGHVSSLESCLAWDTYAPRMT